MTGNTPPAAGGFSGNSAKLTFPKVAAGDKIPLPSKCKESFAVVDGTFFDKTG
jgi:hypothetical protein